MSKKNERFDSYEDEERSWERNSYQDRKEKRREKKIRNALRTRNIDELMEADEEYYDNYYK
jgi:hypothetical protein